MARTISDIQSEIIAAVQADSTLGAQLNSTSVTAIWRLWTYVVASAIWALEVLFDAFKAEATELVAAQKPHTLRWYQQKALDFQLGGTLVEGGDIYDNGALSNDQIVAQKIVAAAAAVEDGSVLIVKVARLSGDELQPLSVPNLAAFTAYMTEIKDAGVKLQTRSVNPDHISLEVDVYYDPTILGFDGARLDGTDNTPVQSAINAFLKENPFNGVFVKSRLTDAMQAVEGVIVPEIRLCQARRDDDPTFGAVDVFYAPFSGFLKIYDPVDLVLNFIPA